MVTKPLTNHAFVRDLPHLGLAFGFKSPGRTVGQGLHATIALVDETAYLTSVSIALEAEGYRS